MKKLKFDSYDGVCFLNGLVFFAPIALLVRTQAGVSEHIFFLLQALLSGVIFLGEIPTGLITDKIGYRKSLILAQILLLTARSLLLGAFLSHSVWLFVAEAVVEGIAACFTSGTGSAYLYNLYGEEGYLAKTTHAGNFGTAGFIISTVAYAGIYKVSGITGLLAATAAADLGSVVMAFSLKKEGMSGSFQGTKRDSETICEQKARDNLQTNENVHSHVEKQERNQELCGKEKEPISIGKSLFILKHPKALFFTAVLSIFSIAWLLINFFYVEKFAACGLPVEWMSAVILIYSAVQMLAEPILEKLLSGGKKRDKRTIMAVTSIVAGAALIAFGIVKNVTVILPLMCIIPLLLNLPEYLLMELENQFVDESGHAHNRAAMLSVMNMGVNLLEILTLSASAFLTKIGIWWSFLLTGVLLCLVALFFVKKSR